MTYAAIAAGAEDVNPGDARQRLDGLLVEPLRFTTRLAVEDAELRLAVGVG